MRRRLLAGVVLIVVAILVGTYPSWVPSGYEVNLPLPTPANAESARQAVREGRIRVPPEFTIAHYAEVRGARMMRPTSRGDLLVSSPGSCEIVLLEADEDGSGEPDGARVLLGGLRRPHGLDIHGGWLYVAEAHAIGRIRFDVDSRELHGDYDHLRDDLPAGGNHWTRTLRVLFATDNGRDHLGDDFPPCEAAVDPVHGFGAHQAPLGLTFIGPTGPPAYRGAALVALHGSWNRSRKAGYKVSALHWQEDGSIVERDFVWGFLKDGDVVGRPVDVVEGARGAVYVSDDFANAVYRILPR